MALGVVSGFGRPGATDMQRRPALQALIGALAFGSATGLAHAAEPVPRPLQVVASFSILGDMAREIAGDAAQVTTLVGPDSDAHVYEPSPADARRLVSAELVLVNGLGFEGWMERLVRSSATAARVVTVSQGVMPRRLDGAADPHAWQSLANAKRYVENIRAALVHARPAQAPAIDARAAAYQMRIDALEAASQARFAAIPATQRRVITTHDAFGYFGEAFNVAFIAPQRWSTEAEPSAADVARVIRQIKSQKARALFIENMTDRRLMDRIAQETGVLVGGTLYADALSAPGTAGDSYLRMLAHNVEAVAGALEAAVPVAALTAIQPKK